MTRIASIFVCLVMAAFGHSAQSADIISDNLANTRNGGQSVNSNSWPAQAFATTATAYVIDEVTLNMSRDAGATGTIELVIYNSAGPGGRPGTPPVTSAFATINVASQLSGTIADITFSNLNVVLDPTTTYYLVLRGVGISGGDALWSYTNTTSGTGFPSNYTETNNGGTTWDAPVQSSPQKMRISAVPEPSTYVLAGLSAITAMLATRRRRARMG